MFSTLQKVILQLFLFPMFSLMLINQLHVHNHTSNILNAIVLPTKTTSINPARPASTKQFLYNFSKIFLTFR